MSNHDDYELLLAEIRRKEAISMGYDPDKMEQAVTLMLEAIGEDPTRSGLRETPKRVSRMWEEFFFMRNYEPTEFAETDSLSNGFVIVRNIPVNSICEHHLVPFIGSAAIGYYPIRKCDGAKNLIGISKLARIVYNYSYRPQIQERLTLQILQEVQRVTQSYDVIVYIEAKHLCMSMRGVKAENCSTITMDYDGYFNSHQSRNEFLTAIKEKV